MAGPCPTFFISEFRFIISAILIKKNGDREKVEDVPPGVRGVRPVPSLFVFLYRLASDAGLIPNGKTFITALY